MATQQKPLHEELEFGRELRIVVGDDTAYDQHHQEVWTNPEKFTDTHTVFIKPDLFSKVFSTERLRLLKALERNPKNMGELTNMLDRPREAISRDINYLVSMGIVRVERNGKERVPSRVGTISVEV